MFGFIKKAFHFTRKKLFDRNSGDYDYKKTDVEQPDAIILGDSSTSNIDQLAQTPIEIVSYISTFLDLQSRLRLARTSNRNHKAVSECLMFNEIVSNETEGKNTIQQVSYADVLKTLKEYKQLSKDVKRLERITYVSKIFLPENPTAFNMLPASMFFLCPIGILSIVIAVCHDTLRTNPFFMGPYFPLAAMGSGIGFGGLFIFSLHAADSKVQVLNAKKIELGNKLENLNIIKDDLDLTAEKLVR